MLSFLNFRNIPSYCLMLLSLLCWLLINPTSKCWSDSGPLSFLPSTSSLPVLLPDRPLCQSSYISVAPHFPSPNGFSVQFPGTSKVLPLNNSNSSKGIFPSPSTLVIMIVATSQLSALTRHWTWVFPHYLITQEVLILQTRKPRMGQEKGLGAVSPWGLSS